MTKRKIDTYKVYNMPPEKLDEVLRLFDIHTFQGLKHRAAFELLYICSITATEVERMNLDDIDLENKTAVCRCMSSRQRLKVRTVPLCDSAIFWLERYLFIRKNIAPQNALVFLAKDDKSSWRTKQLIKDVEKVKNGKI